MRKSINAERCDRPLCHFPCRAIEQLEHVFAGPNDPGEDVNHGNGRWQSHLSKS
jgi:hypothetical protein